VKDSGFVWLRPHALLSLARSGPRVGSFRERGHKYASPLAKRPYDLRHAAVSLWLNAGVPPTQVAEWAGHSVNVLLRVYAKCVYGQEDVAKAPIEAALALIAAVGEPQVAVTSRRTAVDSRFDPITAGPHERPPTGVSAGQGPFQHVVAGEGFEPSKLSRWIYRPWAASL